MGTGKTEQLIKILQEKQCGLIVSSRKSFTNNLAYRLQKSHINVVNYQETSGKLDPSETVVIC
jgi:hypothetical protein